ncbi:Uncharacterized protein FWK35_00030122 [Aphis craccivora]|uniref:Uncharacterized protein n=1 Tax=Aphis craccivora TaxID=307492 RepID=A0A6G0ZES3_APHCR|nr:Uncharacterized protein FWK35_00030122 [Aphis craccivora]
MQVVSAVRPWYCEHCTPLQRCVKCSNEHLAVDRFKSHELTAKCALCFSAHPVNYKSCPSYNNFKRK